MAHSYVCHDSNVVMPWRIRMCVMTHSYVCHDSFVRAPWRISTCFMTHSFIHSESSIHAYFVSFIDSCVLRLGYSYVGHLYACQVSFMHILGFFHERLPWLIHSFVCAMTRSFIYGTSRIRTWSRLTEEIRLKMFGFTDVPDCRVDLLSDGDSVYSRETLFEKFGDSRENMFICTGTLVRTCWKFWQS